jgi:hypothetical protein
MTREIAQQILDKAWRDIDQRKANADLAIAEKRWEDAGNEVSRLRWACSDLEHGFVMMRWVERETPLPPVEKFCGILADANRCELCDPSFTCWATGTNCRKDG